MLQSKGIWGTFYIQMALNCIVHTDLKTFGI